GNQIIRKITPAGDVTTLAGTAGSSGSTNGTGSAARFNSPSGVAVDSSGNVYVADRGNQIIRKITPAGDVTTLAGTAGSSGSTNGTGSAARFNSPSGVAVDSSGNVYVADTQNTIVRKITSVGVVTTLAGMPSAGGASDGVGDLARFFGPQGVAADSMGNVYVSDSSNHTIRRITSGGAVTTFAGLAVSSGATNGTGSSARFNFPRKIAADSNGNIYVSETFYIRKITSGGVVTTFAGTSGSPGTADGTGASARFNGLGGLAVDSSGNLYVADSSNHTIRKITPAAVVSTFAGSPGVSGTVDGTGASARFRSPVGVTVDSSGNVYVADFGNHTIRKITSAGVVTTLAGTAGSSGLVDGMGSSARFNSPGGLSIDSNGDLYVVDYNNNLIRKITSAGQVTIYAGKIGSFGLKNGSRLDATFYQPSDITIDLLGNLYISETGNNVIRKISTSGTVTTFAGADTHNGYVDGLPTEARFKSLSAMTADHLGNIYLTDTDNHIIRKITPNGVVSTFAGLAASTGLVNGVSSTARFNSPLDIATDSAGNLYVTDLNNNAIRKITLAGEVTTLVGSESGIFFPMAVTADNAGNVYIIPTPFSHSVMKISSGGGVSIIAGTGSPGYVDGAGGTAQFFSPFGLTTDSLGNVYVADSGNYIIRKITPGGVVSTLAGTVGVKGLADGAGNSAKFFSLGRLTIDKRNNLYVIDGNRIRKITPSGTVTTVFGSATQQNQYGQMKNSTIMPINILFTKNRLYISSGNGIYQCPLN
ncbi:MAG: hypothetical protein ACK4VO_09880, partial [Pseudobdellovibrio sp.]